MLNGINWKKEKEKKEKQIKINPERKVYHLKGRYWLNSEKKVCHLMEDNILNGIHSKKIIKQVNNVGVNRWKNFIETR